MLLESLALILGQIAAAPERPSVLEKQMRQEYVVRREEFLEGIAPEYRDVAKRDKDMIFILACDDFLKEAKYSSTKVERNKEEFFSLVFSAEPVAEWLVYEEQEKKE